MPPFCNTMSIQRHQSRSRSRNACHASSTAQMSNTKLLLTFVLLGLFIAAASAVDEKKSTDTKSFKTAPPSASTSSLSTLSTNSAAPRDEIYIDDEGIEGSGGRGEIHDDLEKDPDYSGSGFGPDDEDSSTDHHQSIGKNSGKSQNSNDNDFITSRTSNSGTIIGSSGNAGSSGIIDSSNTGINSIGKEYLPPYPPQQQPPHNNHPSTQNTNNSTTTTTTSTTTTASSSSLFPPQPSNPTFPAHSPPTRKDDDYDDFDLDETIGGASGDGNIHDSDDDNTGDDDIDEEIIKRVNHMHDLNKGIAFVHNADNDDDNDGDDTSIDGATKVDEEIRHRTNPYGINTLSGGAYEPESPRVAVGATETNSQDKDQSTDIDVDEEDEDDAGTDVYTDVTDTTVGTHKRPGNNQGTIHELDATNNVNSLPTDTKVEHTTGNEVLIMSDDDRTTSFFAQPGILAAVIGGAVVGLLCAILVVMFIVYRMRKKDEGSYALDEPKRSPAVNSYAKNANNREFYA